PLRPALALAHLPLHDALPIYRAYCTHSGGYNSDSSIRTLLPVRPARLASRPTDDVGDYKFPGSHPPRARTPDTCRDPTQAALRATQGWAGIPVRGYRPNRTVAPPRPEASGRD